MDFRHEAPKHDSCQLTFNRGEVIKKLTEDGPSCGILLRNRDMHVQDAQTTGIS